MIIGVDFGMKNIGLAYATDTLAVAWQTVPAKEFVSFLRSLITEKLITEIVFGYPLKNENQSTKTSSRVDQLIEMLSVEFPSIKSVKIDESMTTQIAVQILRNNGYSPQSIEEKKDSESARIILQSYLDEI